MLIKSLRLRNYRNHHSFCYEFDEHLNIICGDNGAGKTNILESIIVLSNTRSFRTNNDRDLIEKGEDFSLIQAICSTGKLKMVINQKGKSLFYNDISLKKTSEFIGKINSVLFKPSDIELFVDSPRERRKILDLEIGKVSPVYLKALFAYNELLKDKNRLLKEMNPDQTYLELLNEQMAKEIKTIIIERENFFKMITPEVQNYYQQISGSSQIIHIAYKRSMDPDEVLKRLNETLTKDLYYHYAVIGPHHEDYSFFFEDKEVNSIASQGQKRMLMIAFKLAIVAYIHNILKEMPVILLDDLFSELDLSNQQRLLKTLPENSQVIITGTDTRGIRIDKKHKELKLEVKTNG